MTKQGVKELYMWMTASWPLVIRPGAGEAFQAAKMGELYETYKDFKDEDVVAAFHKWTEENDKFPTTKNILNEIKWAQQASLINGRENVELWPMDIIKDNGDEWSYGFFRREDFVSHKMNPNHLQPEEWERRFKIRRRQVLDRIYKRARS